MKCVQENLMCQNVMKHTRVRGLSTPSVLDLMTHDNRFNIRGITYDGLGLKRLSYRDRPAVTGQPTLEERTRGCMITTFKFLSWLDIKMELSVIWGRTDQLEDTTEI